MSLDPAVLQAALSSPVPSPNALLQALWPSLDSNQKEHIGALLSRRKIATGNSQGNTGQLSTTDTTGKPVVTTPITPVTAAPAGPTPIFSIPTNTSGIANPAQAVVPSTPTVQGTPLVSTKPTAAAPSGTGVLPSDTQAIAQGLTQIGPDGRLVPQQGAVNDLLRRANGGVQPMGNSDITKNIGASWTNSLGQRITVGGGDPNFKGNAAALTPEQNAAFNEQSAAEHESTISNNVT